LNVQPLEVRQDDKPGFRKTAAQILNNLFLCSSFTSDSHLLRISEKPEVMAKAIRGAVGIRIGARAGTSVSVGRRPQRAD